MRRRETVSRFSIRELVQRHPRLTAAAATVGIAVGGVEANYGVQDAYQAFRTSRAIARPIGPLAEASQVLVPDPDSDKKRGKSFRTGPQAVDQKRVREAETLMAKAKEDTPDNEVASIETAEGQLSGGDIQGAVDTIVGVGGRLNAQSNEIWGKAKKDDGIQTGAGALLVTLGGVVIFKVGRRENDLTPVLRPRVLATRD